eukprot:10990997-Alexandrium_andersonii.AAC.1
MGVRAIVVSRSSPLGSSRAVSSVQTSRSCHRRVSYRSLFQAPPCKVSSVGSAPLPALNPTAITRSVGGRARCTSSVWGGVRGS